jgi:hypothetical protein
MSYDTNYANDDATGLADSDVDEKVAQFNAIMSDVYRFGYGLDAHIAPDRFGGFELRVLHEDEEVAEFDDDVDAFSNWFYTLTMQDEDVIALVLRTGRDARAAKAASARVVRDIQQKAMTDAIAIVGQREVVAA